MELGYWHMHKLLDLSLSVIAPGRLILGQNNVYLEAVSSPGQTKWLALAESEEALKQTELLHIKTDIV